MDASDLEALARAVAMGTMTPEQLADYRQDIPAQEEAE